MSNSTAGGRARSIVAAACLALLFGVVSQARAATFTVDTTIDAPDFPNGDGICASTLGGCTLRAAVQEANALSGPDDIVLPAGSYVLTRVGRDDAGTVGDLDVVGDLTITGAGASTTEVDGNHTSRVFEVVLGSLAMSGVTVRGGQTEDDFAGGISAPGTTMELTDCVVTDNHGNIGGGLLGQMTIVRTTVSNNTADLIGGGMLAGGEMRDSVSFGNSVSPTSALEGRDVAANAVPLIVRNSTLDEIHNVSFCVPQQSGCSSGAPIVLSNVTVGSLSSFDGGGGPGSFTLRNTIVFDRCTVTVTSQGYNLVSSNTGNCTIHGTTTGNLVGVDALLGPLTDNGGPTLTRRLGPGSPARDAGNPAVPGSGGTACEANDQRGVARPSGPRCDIGAFESQCGDGVTQAGEQCDDCYETNGDGCDVNCTPSACGNGVVAPGEDCDDGGTSAGDCCGPACQFEPAGQPCPADGNPCTDERCDGAGACGHLPNSGPPCSDGHPCTNGDHCVNGACVSGQFCDPCHWCVVPAGCVMPSCTRVSATRASLLLAKGATEVNDRLKFRWKDGAVDKNDFDDPGGSLPPRFCLYDDGGNVLMSAAAPEDGCDGEACWKESRQGFSYRDPELSPDGLRTMSLRAGSSGRIRVDGRGANLDLTLPGGAPVKASLLSPTQAICFDADFQSATTSSTRFKARLP